MPAKLWLYKETQICRISSTEPVMLGNTATLMYAHRGRSLTGMASRVADAEASLWRAHERHVAQGSSLIACDHELRITSEVKDGLR